jgi:uncharacterized cupin superfamily protein
MDSSPPDIIDFARALPERSASTPEPDRLLAGQPEQVANNFFTDATGQFFAGRWESTSSATSPADEFGS